MKKLISTFIIFCLNISINYAQNTGITFLQDYAYTKVVIVSATQQWTPTNITLNKGDSVTIYCDGIASTDGASDVNGAYWFGPDGNGRDVSNQAHPMPSAPGQSVIGKIGDSGQPFFIGKHVSFVLDTTGTLILGYNDNQLFDNYGYYVAFINIKSGSPTKVGVNNKTITNYSLSQNYPNPFNPSTNINYTMPATAKVQIRIYDINGNLINNLVDNIESAGNHVAQWNGKNQNGTTVASGAYFYQIQIGDFVQAKKMILLK